MLFTIIAEITALSNRLDTLNFQFSNTPLNRRGTLRKEKTALLERLAVANRKLSSEITKNIVLNRAVARIETRG